MRCNQARQHMMDRLYEDLPAKQAEKLDRHIESCPHCAQEWKAVQEGHEAMKQMHEVAVPSPLQEDIHQFALSPAEEDARPAWKGYRTYSVAASFLLFVTIGGMLCWHGNPPPARSPETKNSSAIALNINDNFSRKDAPAIVKDVSNLKSVDHLAPSSDKSQKPVQLASVDEDILVIQPPHPDDVMIHHPGPYPDDVAIHSPSKRDSYSFHDLAPRKQGKRQEKSSPAAAKRKEKKDKAKTQPTRMNSHLAMTGAKPSDDTAVKTAVKKENAGVSAKEYFQTGLKLYNTAFKKVGEEKQSLLHSAVIFLRDLETRFPKDSKWVALSLILKADAQKQLQKYDESIHTYQSMIRKFYNMEPYCQQARASILHVLVNNREDYEQARIALKTFHQLYPDSSQFTQLAFALAEKIVKNDPEKALTLYKEVMQTHEEAHPAWNKAHRLAKEAEKKIEERYLIKDFWFLGPVEDHTTSRAVLPFDLKHEFKNAAGKICRWQRPFTNEVGVVDAKSFVPNLKENQAMYAFTHIHCKDAQRIYILFGGSQALRLWLNGDPVYGQSWQQPYKPNQDSIRCGLKEGWNTLMVKTYPYIKTKEWKFSIKITDDNGHIMPFLKVDPTKDGEFTK